MFLQDTKSSLLDQCIKQGTNNFQFQSVNTYINKYVIQHSLPFFLLFSIFSTSYQPRKKKCCHRISVGHFCFYLTSLAPGQIAFILHRVLFLSTEWLLGHFNQCQQLTRLISGCQLLRTSTVHVSKNIPTHGCNILMHTWTAFPTLTDMNMKYIIGHVTSCGLNHSLPSVASDSTPGEICILIHSCP